MNVEMSEHPFGIFTKYNTLLVADVCEKTRL